MQNYALVDEAQLLRQDVILLDVPGNDAELHMIGSNHDPNVNWQFR